MVSCSGYVGSGEQNQPERQFGGIPELDLAIGTVLPAFSATGPNMHWPHKLR